MAIFHLLQTLLSHCSAQVLVVSSLAISGVMLSTGLSIVSLIKEFSMSKDDWDYLQYAEKRSTRDRYRDRYDKEQDQRDEIQDGLSELAETEGDWETDDFPDPTGSEDDGPDF